MKKITLAALCLALAMLISGCDKNNEPIHNNEEINAEIEESGSVNESEQESETETESENASNKEETNETNKEPPEKEILKLQYLPVVGHESTEPTIINVDIAYSNLSENAGERYDGNAELQIFADYMSNEFNIEVNSNWKIFVHFYDMDKTMGMVQFQYYIGNIGTNKSIVFNLNNGKVDQIFYSCLDNVTDEESLKSRVETFETRYEQEKYLLKDGETFESESVNYSYNYDTGDLIYSYSVFFSYGEWGVINNDYGTVCFIDESGAAVNETTDEEVM